MNSIAFSPFVQIVNILLPAKWEMYMALIWLYITVLIHNPHHPLLSVINPRIKLPMWRHAQPRGAFSKW
jgi:hypothetical protein